MGKVCCGEKKRLTRQPRNFGGDGDVQLIKGIGNVNSNDNLNQNMENKNKKKKKKKKARKRNDGRV